MTAPPGAQNGYDRHAAAQRLAWKQLTPLQRLRWLDQAKAFAEKARRAAEARRLGRLSD